MIVRGEKPSCLGDYWQNSDSGGYVGLYDTGKYCRELCPHKQRCINFAAWLDEPILDKESERKRWM